MLNLVISAMLIISDRHYAYIAPTFRGHSRQKTISFYQSIEFYRFLMIYVGIFST